MLRAAGVRRGRRGRPKFGWTSLTPAERAVAGLVPGGLTNPQIGARLCISRRIVHTRLVHAVAKLDMASRAQPAAQLARHGPQGPPPGTAASTDHAPEGAHSPARGRSARGCPLCPRAPAAGHGDLRATATLVRVRRQQYRPNGGCRRPPRGGTVDTFARTCPEDPVPERSPQAPAPRLGRDRPRR